MTKPTQEAKTFEELQSLVIQWSKDRKIIPNSTPWAQFQKFLEEVSELEASLEHLPVKGGPEDLIDAIGDCTVVLINIAALSGLDVVECLEHAWEQIKDRKGTLSPEGIFVKEGT